jgi:hypothetical protein
MRIDVKPAKKSLLKKMEGILDIIVRMDVPIRYVLRVFPVNVYLDPNVIMLLIK